MSKCPRISIIIPVYNVEAYITECINSVKAQTFTDYEVIIVNDGSTDRSLNIAERLGDNFQKIKIISQPNQGLSAARNRGVKEASGEFMFFLDSDDYILPETLEALYNACLANSCDLAVCGVQIFNEKTSRNILYQTGKCSSIEWVKLLLSGRAFSWSCNKLYKKSIWIKNNLEFPIGRTYEDIAISISMMEFYDRIAIVNLPLYQYRLRAGSIVSSFSEKKMLDFICQTEDAVRRADDIISVFDSTNEKEIYIQSYHILQLSEILAMRVNIDSCTKTTDERVKRLLSKISINDLFLNKLSWRYKLRFMYYYMRYRFYRKSF